MNNIKKLIYIDGRYALFSYRQNFQKFFLNLILLLSKEFNLKSQKEIVAKFSKYANDDCYTLIK